MKYLNPAARDTVLFLVGIAGIVYVTLTDGGDRPTLLVLFGAMVGLPAFLRGDEARSSKNETPPDVKKEEAKKNDQNNP